jgi:hypothetical protein
VICFAAVGVRDGWGPAVAGAFALLSGFAGVGAIVLGQVGLRQTRRAPDRISGRGPAIAGIVCAIVGLVVSALAIVLSLAAVAAGSNSSAPGTSGPASWGILVSPQRPQSHPAAEGLRETLATCGPSEGAKSPRFACSSARV